MGTATATKVAATAAVIQLQATTIATTLVVASAGQRVTVSAVLDETGRVAPNLFDTFSVVDSLATVILKSASPHDAISVADNLSSVRVYVRAISDTVAISDAAGRTVGKSLADTAAIADISGQLTVKALTDSVAASDGFSYVYTVPKNIADTVTASDAIAKTYALARSDGVIVTDSIVRGIGAAKTDSVTMSDSATENLIHTVATFIGTQHSAGGSNVTLPGGAQAGDFAIMFAADIPGGTGFTPPTGWTRSAAYAWVNHPSLTFGCVCKVLTSADITAGALAWATNSQKHLAVYRGGSSLVLLNADNNDNSPGATTSNVGGAVSGSVLGLIGWAGNLGATGSNGAPPGGWTSRDTSWSGGSYGQIVADYLGSPYPNVTSGVSFGSTAGGVAVGLVLEID